MVANGGDLVEHRMDGIHSAAKPQPKMANGKWQMAQAHTHRQFSQAAKILMDSSTRADSHFWCGQGWGVVSVRV
jgi:hypothetical protein